VIMIIIVFIFAFAIKNLIIIQMKKCIHYERYYYVKSECRDKHFHLKRNHQNRKNQSNRDDQDNKWRKKR
jgi:predicted nucleotidyltransferase